MRANGFRRVYYHHLKKCGGTSLNQWLSLQTEDRRAFAHDWLKPLASAFLNDLDMSAEVAALERRIGPAVFHWTDTVYTHVPLRRWAPSDALCCTVLREPTDRLLSQVADWRRLSAQDLRGLPDPVVRIISAASAVPLRRFLEDYGRHTLLFDNYLVRALAAARLGFAVRGIEPRDLLDDALDSLTHSFHVVGLTDRLAVSLNAIAGRLGLPPVDDAPHLNETRSRVLLADEIDDAREILSELTALDKAVYARALQLFDERHVWPGTSYNRSEFERLYAAETLRELVGVKDGLATIFSVRDPIVGSAFHGRDAAGSDQCRVWTGPSNRSILYMPVTAGTAVELQLWIRGYAAESQRDRLKVYVDGTPVPHRFVVQEGYRDVLTIQARPTRSFVALEVDTGEALASGVAGQPGSDARRRGLSFDRYGWTPSDTG